MPLVFLVYSVQQFPKKLQASQLLVLENPFLRLGILASGCYQKCQQEIKFSHDVLQIGFGKQKIQK